MIEYVRVKSIPKPWDGSGESKEQQKTLVGHVGLVIEMDIDNEQSLIRFPSHRVEGETFQRWIEWTALTNLTMIGTNPISDSLLDENGVSAIWIRKIIEQAAAESFQTFLNKPFVPGIYLDPSNENNSSGKEDSPE